MPHYPVVSTWKRMTFSLWASCSETYLFAWQCFVWVLMAKGLWSALTMYVLVTFACSITFHGSTPFASLLRMPLLAYHISHFFGPTHLAASACLALETFAVVKCLFGASDAAMWDPIGLITCPRCGVKWVTAVCRSPTTSFMMGPPDTDPVHSVTYGWLNAFLRRHQYSPETITVASLPMPHAHHKASDVHARCPPVTTTNNIPLWRHLLFSSPLGRDFLFCVPAKVSQDLLQFASPYVVHRMVRFLTTPGGGGDNGAVIVAVAATCLIAQNILFQLYLSGLYSVGMDTTTTLRSMVMAKCHRLRSHTSASEGDVTTLLQVDATRVQDAVIVLHNVWGHPLVILVCLYLLHNSVGWGAMLTTTVIVALLIPANVRVGKSLKLNTDEMMSWKDKRIRKSNETLNAIRTVKTNAWESDILKSIVGIREEEERTMRRGCFLESLRAVYSEVTVVLVSIVCFTTFVALGGTLSAAVVVPALSVISILRFPMWSMPNLVSALTKGLSSVQRMEAFLALDEEAADTTGGGGVPGTLTLQGDFSWNPREINYLEGEPFALRGLDINIMPGDFIAVVGDVGAGKSSLLCCCLGALVATNGHNNNPTVAGTMGYCHSTPYIRNRSIRENIVCGRHVDEGLYKRVIAACGLDHDIATFSRGDATIVGERGATLSGGQKSRLALARACYRNADVYLLDSVVASLDTVTSAAIVQECFMGLLATKTRIVVVDANTILRGANKVCILERGRVRFFGDVKDYERTQHKQESEASSGGVGREMDHTVPEPVDDTHVQKRHIGSVGLDVYTAYISAYGAWNVGLILFFSVLAQFVQSFGDVWLGAYSAGTDTTQFFGVYAVIGAVSAAVMGARTAMYFFGSVRSAGYFHTAVLGAVLRCPMSFFDTTPIGRVTHALTKDQDKLDTDVPASLNFFVLSMLRLGAAVVVNLIVCPAMAVVLAPLGFLLDAIVGMYMRVSREVKRLENSTRGPLVTLAKESIQGVLTIRAHGQQGAMMGEFYNALDCHNRAYHASNLLSRWVGLRLDLISSTFVVVSCAFAVAFREDISPALSGIAILYAFNFSRTLLMVCRRVAAFENELTSVERMLDFMGLPGEKEATTSPCPPTPSTGSIEFQSVSMKYRPGLGYALRSATFRISAGECVGIVGRTGAGKSSLCNALLRFADVIEGTILIGGVNARDILLANLRHAVSVLPQDPVLLSGTLRSNIDPTGLRPDSALIASMPPGLLADMGGLSGAVSENGDNLSVGTRQLVCLARASLRDSPILVLDEATSNIDEATTTAVIANARMVASRTLLIIAHRFSTVLNCDRVMVVDDGRVVEFAAPHVLAADPKSAFSRLQRATE